MRTHACSGGHWVPSSYSVRLPPMEKHRCPQECFITPSPQAPRNYQPPLNYSDHSLPLWNVLISSSCPQRQSQRSSSHLPTEVKLPRSLVSCLPTTPAGLCWTSTHTLSSLRHLLLPSYHLFHLQISSAVSFLSSPNPHFTTSSPPHTLSQDNEKGALKFHLLWWIT